MTQILYISSSLSGSAGQSTQLADRYIAKRQDKGDDVAITRRDLHADPVPHLDGERFAAFTTPAAERSKAQREVAAFSDQLIDELRRADEIVIALPMYNMGVPSTFKAWIDHVARAGETFRYTANGPQGLLEDKAVTVLAARGGMYAGTPQDSQTQYVKDILGLMGLTQVDFIYAEGLNMGDEQAQPAIHDAQQQIDRRAA